MTLSVRLKLINHLHRLCRPSSIELTVQTIQGNFQTFTVNRNFLAEIERNEESQSRARLLQEVVALVAKHVAQTRGSLKYLCTASHSNPGMYSYSHYVRLFLHVQLNHHPLKPNFCLVCGDTSLACHFRATQKGKIGGKGFTGTCKVQIDATDSRESRK